MPKELRRLSAKLMANRSDRHLSNLSNCQGAKPVRLIRGRCADFPSWPGVQHGAPSRGRIHDRNRISAIRAATLRTGLGPYMGPYMSVRISPAPPASPQFSEFSYSLRKKRAFWPESGTPGPPENWSIRTICKVCNMRRCALADFTELPSCAGRAQRRTTQQLAV